METDRLITIQQFCVLHDVSDSFIISLNEFGLVEIITIGQQQYLQHDQLRELEKIIRLHNDLHINLEGIDTITSLLQRLESMQQELIAARNRLRLYEE
ncbi:MAG TPA: chaperone modulator CbpM [Cytophagaceae bacterium]|jgi:cell division FtsZ-interacting protein ZapD|nr:chaperone modulator CbpM [Cytophagaceae bacterium]